MMRTIAPQRSVEGRRAARRGYLALLLVVGLWGPAAHCAAAEAETCEQIRARIGTLPPPDADLLRTLAVRRDCGFSSADFYKAAYGDRPPAPRGEARSGHRSHHGHEEQDDD